MKRCSNSLVFASAACALAFFTTIALGDVATVTADRVNVRARNATNSELIKTEGGDSLQLKQGDSVELLEAMPAATDTNALAFVKIRMPSAGKVWIHRDMIDATKGVVIKNNVNLRSGPDIKFGAVGKINNNEPVQVLQQQGEWVAIKPNMSCYAFVAAKFLHSGSPAPAGSATASAAPAAAPAVPAAPAVVPAPPPAVEMPATTQTAAATKTEQAAPVAPVKPEPAAEPVKPKEEPAKPAVTEAPKKAETVTPTQTKAEPVKKAEPAATVADQKPVEKKQEAKAEMPAAPEPVPAPTVTAKAEETKPAATPTPEPVPAPTVVTKAESPAPKAEEQKKADVAGTKPEAMPVPVTPAAAAADKVVADVKANIEKSREDAKKEAMQVAKLESSAQKTAEAAPVAPKEKLASKALPDASMSPSDVPAPADVTANTKPVTRDGWLRVATGLFKKPGTHQLMSSDKPLEAMLLCFISSQNDSLNLAQYEGKHVRIVGQEKWIKGWNQALIELSNVELLK